jgi:hypothetical protein
MPSLTNKLSAPYSFKTNIYPLLITFFLGFFLIGCGGGGGSSDGNNGNSGNGGTPPATIIDAQTPNIITHPQNATYTQGETATALSVSASVNDGGDLGYQWYNSSTNSNSAGSPILGATNPNYTPLTSAVGTTYYYVVVTNTNNNVNGAKTANVTSNTAFVNVAGVANLANYTVSFYDSNLDLLAAFDKLPSGHNVALTSNKTEFGVSDWYLKNSDVSLSSYTLTDNNVSFYAAENVREITTQGELYDVRNNLSDNYILLNNITLTEATLGNDNGEGWLPIGDDSDYFEGIFNGNGNKISGIWANRNTDYVGLFGFIYNAQIRNLGVEIAKNKKIIGNEKVGGIVGRSYYGNITNSYLTGNVGEYQSGRYIGGIAGQIERSSIINSYSNGSINGYFIVGGIVGDMSGGSITNSYSNGTIVGYQRIGGIVGTVDQFGSITNSYSSMTVSSPSHVGGIVGTVHYATIQNNVAINPSVTGEYGVGINRVIGDISDGVTASNNFALSNMGGSFTNSGNKTYHGTSKTAGELKQETFYNGTISGDGFGGLGWKFNGKNNDAPWEINSTQNNGYPYLYWQDKI